jgi:DNA-binding IclR family transcriptional regulator
MIPESAAELSTSTNMSRSAVYDNLRWLEQQKLVRKLGHTWLFNTSPGVVETPWPVERAEQWVRARDRYARERDQYDEYFRYRYGIDRQTGEILDER